MLKGFTQYYEKYKHVQWIDMKKWLAERYRSMAASEINQKNYREAGEFLIQAVKLNPFGWSNFKTLFYLLRRSVS